MILNQRYKLTTVSRPLPARVWLLSKTSFLRLGLFVGSLFAFTTPPFQVADESRHFARAYGLSERALSALRLIPARDSLPASLVQALNQTAHWQDVSSPKATVGQIIDLMRVRLRPDQRARYAETASYSFVSYLPQMAVIMPLRLAGANAVLTLYVARLAALLFWIVLTYRAIRLIPVGRQLLAFIALLPMTLFQAGSLSADCVTNALSFLLIAAYLRLASQARPVRLGQLLAVGGLGAVLTVAKFVYAPLIGLYLLIPPARFQSPARYVGGGALVAGLALLVLLAPFNSLFMLAKAPYTHAGLAGADPTPYPQLNFWLADPLNVLRTLGATGARWGRTYMDGFVGSLGWYGADLPSYLCVVTIVLLWLTAFTTDEPFVLSLRQKSLLLALAGIITAVICVGMSMDLRENPVPSLQLRGLQGRYFTPIAVLIGLLASNRFSPIRRYQNAIDALRLPFIGFLLANAYYCLLERYYL